MIGYTISSRRYRVIVIQCNLESQDLAMVANVVSLDFSATSKISSYARFFIVMIS